MTPSPAPWRQRRDLRTTLNRAFRAMLSPAWDRALARATEADKREAARLLLRLQSARLRLGNAELAQIRDRLQGHEAELRRGRERLERSLRQLGRLRSVLSATRALLDAVGQVVKLAA